LRQETQQQLASSLTGEINGLIAAGSFSAAFNTAQQTENDRAEVEISFYQAAGSGATASVTLDVNEILTRLSNFTAIAHDNPFPFKAEIATYDTIPIPIPPPVEIEDFIFSMSQDENKKLDYIKRKNDVDFALNHAEYFDDLPSPTDLRADSGVYTQLINAVMAHQVRLAKGQFPTPEVFDPAKVGLTEPIPRQFKRKAGGSSPANSWAIKTPMPAARGNLGLVAARDGKLYAVGGTVGSDIVASVVEYDPSTNAWTAAAPMPFAQTGHGVAAASNGKIYAVGGFSGGDDEDPNSGVAEYDPATNAWTTRALMPTSRSELGLAAAANGKLYAVGGGNNDSPGVLNVVEEYDPATNRWATKAPMPTARFLFGLTAASNGKLYAVGGVDSKIHTVATVEEYDPATNSWATKAPMPTPRSGLGLAAASNGKLYAVGGAGGLDVVEEYDPATNRWTPKTPMPTGREQFGLAAASNGKLYAAGGISAPNNARVAILEEYTP
jgi:N-acetylneuraminic acid mutarotase